METTKAIDELKDYRSKLSKLTEDEHIGRDLYLKKIANGTMQGPPTGYPEIDKPGLSQYSDADIQEKITEKSIYEFSYSQNLNNLDNKILNYFNKKITTKELFDEVDRIAEILVNDYNISEGDVVSIALPTIPETYYLFLALNKISAIANFIDPRINEERIKSCIGNDSKLIFSVDAYNEKFDCATKDLSCEIVSVSAASSLGNIKKMLYNKKAQIKQIKRFIQWDDFKKGKSNESHKTISVNPGDKNKIAARISTSGTTGVPKIVNLSNYAINSVAFHQRKHMPDLNEGDNYLVIMPPFIAYGLVCGMCAPLSACQKMILIPKFEPKDFSKLILKHRPNHILGVPSFYEDLIKNPIFKNKNLSFLKYCIAGGDKMNVETEKKINEFFKKHNIKNNIVKGYGMTELSSAAFSTPNNEQNKLGSVGIPYLKNKVRIVDLETGKNLTYNQKGEIYVASPSMMDGYSNNENETQKVIIKDEYNQEWVKTGDIGYVDNKGNTTITDRIKRMIVRPDGHNVFPSTIEAIINSHNAVQNSVVIGVKSEKYDNGKIPTAIIVLKEEYKTMQDKIEQEINSLSLEKLPPRDVALCYKFVDSLPLTSVGKIDVKMLEEEFSKQGRAK